MRTLFTTAAVAVLFVFGLQSVSWGQQQGGSNQSGRTSVGSAGSSFQTGGDASPGSSSGCSVAAAPSVRAAAGALRAGCAGADPQAIAHANELVAENHRKHGG